MFQQLLLSTFVCIKIKIFLFLTFQTTTELLHTEYAIQFRTIVFEKITNIELMLGEVLFRTECGYVVCNPSTTMISKIFLYVSD